MHDRIATCFEELDFQGAISGFPRKILDGRIYLKIGIFIVFIEFGPDPEILDVKVFGSKKKNISEDPAQMPEILVLEVGSIAPAIDLDGKCVPFPP